MRVETTMLSPETRQYEGKGGGAMTIGSIVEEARRVEDLGFDGGTTPEAGHDPYVPLARRRWPGTCSSSRADASSWVWARRSRATSSVATRPRGRARRDRACASTSSASRPCSRAIEHSHVPIYLAAVNPYMARLSGEHCDGLRVHPISTFSHNREVLVPNVEKGAQKSGRSLADIDIVGCPFLAVSRDEAGLEAAKDAVRQRISFYASTRTYHSVLDFHGWTDVGQELHRLSVKGSWMEMPGLITDEMLEEFAIVAVGDDLGPKLKERSRGIFTTVLLDGAPDLMSDEAWLRRTIAVLQEPG
jgi:alkanesulfonate monooxygenase SsuD/methylene tetrahydromethanopterin reductase-like flavin-dependent oxidoreductase (luciferase family)